MNMYPKRFSNSSFYECCLLNIVDGGDDVFIIFFAGTLSYCAPLCVNLLFSLFTHHLSLFHSFIKIYSLNLFDCREERSLYFQF